MEETFANMERNFQIAEVSGEREKVFYSNETVSGLIGKRVLHLLRAIMRQLNYISHSRFFIDLT